MARGPGKGKTNNPNGRTKGTPNKTTKEARELFIKVVEGQFKNIEGALKELYNKDKAKYIDSLTKLIQYVLPRKTDITTDDKPIALPDIIIKTHD